MEASAGIFLFFFFFFFSTIIHHTLAADTISSGESLTYGQTLISKGGVFELGFFSPGNARRNYYIGIWYNKISVQNKTYVWVANRAAPLTDPTSSELKLLEDGNLVLFNKFNNAIWSTSSSSNAIISSEAVLGDDGNFVLRNGIRPSDVFWQSFDYPTDTWLRGGKIRYDNRTKKAQLLTCWKNRYDPSEGLFSLVFDSSRDQYSINMNLTQVGWSSGRWNGQIFSGVPEMGSFTNFSYVKNENETYITYSVINDTSIISRIVLDLSGQIKHIVWNEVSQQWLLIWSQPRQQCEVYAFCGSFGVCNEAVQLQPYCRCMEGFEPRSLNDWDLSDFSSGGCVRRTSLQCGDNEAFSLMSNVRLPANQTSWAAASADECKSACLNLKNCSCIAYAYTSECLIWKGDLLNIQQLSHGGDKSGDDLYLRLAASDSKNAGGKYMKIILPVASSAVLVLGFILGYIVLKQRPHTGNTIITNNKYIASTITCEKEEDLELPLFDMVTIATATDNFSVLNKIGQGGFGPVYKGILPTSGQEIAIKRLSKDSRQGLEEFMNEVVLIAKLQHRNLVRLLGCCTQGDERMLVYEYMPNKSLDFFIFDKGRNINLNWNMRFNIIVGIARGLLYLHRDSRLRIIHRDLKAGNVLLDSEMNPKISDFGMARILRGDQTQENTMRVVGTYGYMSPEYAIEGLFSMKSDVFSFGVLVLEIVSGEKNRGFHHANHNLNLVGHAWKLLNDNKTLELVDASIINDSVSIYQVLKCVQVGLLCVQKFPDDRPTMASILSLLDSDGALLPLPKEPGFYTERCPFEKDSPSIQVLACTDIEVTVTLLEGR